MGWFTGIIVYLLIWWVAIFMVLPWGLQHDVDGTPRVPNLKKKLIATTILSALLWIILYGIIEADIISFRDIAFSMIEKDQQS